MDTLPTRELDRPLVVIGASAGGVEALKTLVASLSPDFPAPVVVALHIERTWTSQLGEILSARSALPVRTVTGREQLQPGTIFLVPANRDVEIDDHHVGVHTDTIGPSRPSVDRLLTTAARMYGDELIAVILTGTGADGAIGAQAVKAYGGTVIVQNPETAQFPGMPNSVPPITIDIVTDLEAIGPLLGALLRGDYKLPGEETDDELRSFLDRVRERTGFDFRSYKRPTIARRLQRRMAAVDAETLMEYRRYAERHPDELQRLVASFLIKVTEFFRDPELFEYLRANVLPGLIAAARERGELRLWSVGCATGEEAYSLGMLVTDLLAGDTTSLPIRIFATDISVDAVEFGRRGAYPESALTGLPRELIDRHFVHLDGIYEVRKQVRSLVVFGEHDLGHRAPFPRIDLVLCRNVMIYFTPELQRRALQLFAYSLRRGGYLALGKAESVSPFPEYFTLEQPRLKVFRRIGEAALIPAKHGVDPRPLHRAGLSRRSGGRILTPVVSVPEGQLPAPQVSRLLDELTTGVAIVDRNYHIRSINLAARRLLGVRSAALGEDLIHRMAPQLAGELQTTIDTALGGTLTSITSRVPRDVVEGGRDIAITCSPLGVSEPGTTTEMVLIEVSSVTPLLQRQRTLEAERDQVLVADTEMRADLAVAVAEVRELRAANEAMATEQGRLLAENEQLLLATEEAQAATEEIETLNEELQATNEELETLNEELHATVEELTTTNDELQAKSAELQELSASLEAQHRASKADWERLAAVLGNMGDAVLVLDASGTIVLTNAAYERLFGTGADFVPENEQGEPLPIEDRPQQRAVRGETFTVQFTQTDADGRRRWFEANSQPVPGTGGGQWSVVVFRDITERSLRRMQEEFLAVASHELRTPLTTLSGSLQLLQRRLRATTTDNRLETLVERALDQTHRLQRHIAELMDVARLQGGKLRLERAPVDLTTLVSRIAETADFLDSEQTIRVTMPDQPVIYNGDAHRLQQVVFNLLTNAMTHASESEVIDLRLRHEPEQVVLEVQDYGPGVPEDKLQMLFSRFFQGDASMSSHQGLGLGLYIAKEVVTAHSGEIAVESTLGQGTTFIVRLPNPPVSPSA